jgi:hypothetical protein
MLCLPLAKVKAKFLGNCVELSPAAALRLTSSIRFLLVHRQFPGKDQSGSVLTTHENPYPGWRQDRSEGIGPRAASGE